MVASRSTLVSCCRFQRAIASRSTDDSVIATRGVSSTGHEATSADPSAGRNEMGAAKNPAKPRVSTAPAASRCRRKLSDRVSMQNTLREWPLRRRARAEHRGGRGGELARDSPLVRLLPDREARGRVDQREDGAKGGPHRRVGGVDAEGEGDRADPRGVIGRALLGRGRCRQGDVGGQQEPFERRADRDERGQIDAARGRVPDERRPPRQREHVGAEERFRGRPVELPPGERVADGRGRVVGGMPDAAAHLPRQGRVERGQAPPRHPHALVVRRRPRGVPERCGDPTCGEVVDARVDPRRQPCGGGGFGRGRVSGGATSRSWPRISPTVTRVPPMSRERGAPASGTVNRRAACRSAGLIRPCAYRSRKRCSGRESRTP